VTIFTFGLVLTNGVMRTRQRINSSNQTVFGWSVGVWIAYVFAVLLREPIFNHIKALVSDDDEMVWYGRTP